MVGHAQVIKGLAKEFFPWDDSLRVLVYWPSCFTTHILPSIHTPGVKPENLSSGHARKLVVVDEANLGIIPRFLEVDGTHRLLQKTNPIYGAGHF